MPVDAVLIQQPAIDFATLLGLSRKALGYSPASAADASRRELSDTERFLSCLAAIRDQGAPAGLTPNLLSFVDFSVLIAAADRDVLEILSAAAGMPFVTAETVAAGVSLTVLKGTLAQWRDAVKTGMSASAAPNVRACYTKVLSLFEKAGLAAVWNDLTKRSTPNGLLLEDKRK